MASEPPFLVPLKEALRDLLAWWKAAKVDALIIGGLAAALLGRPRMTRDLDGLVWLDEPHWEGFLAASTRFGMEARLPDVLAFARSARVLLLRHTASQIDIDIAFAALPFERQALDRAQWIRVGGLRLPLPAPEDLIIMKAIAHRPRDLADVDAIIAAQPRLNRRRLRKQLREFASLLEMPELVRDMEQRLIRQVKAKTKGQKRPRRRPEGD